VFPSVRVFLVYYWITYIGMWSVQVHQLRFYVLTYCWTLNIEYHHFRQSSFNAVVLVAGRRNVNSVLESINIGRRIEGCHTFTNGHNACVTCLWTF